MITVSFIAPAAVGIIVGLVVGALGGGGGIIAVPVLTYFLGQNPHDATNASLIIVAITSLIAMPGKAKRGHIRWRDGAVFGALSCTGAVAGRLINQGLDGEKLLVFFSALLLAVSALMMRNARTTRAAENTIFTEHGVHETPPSTDPAVAAHRAPRPLPIVALAAFTTGALTGIFGVGGGFASVPVLILVMRFPVRQATGTSLLVTVIAAAASMATGIAHHSFHVDWPVALLFVAGSSIASIAAVPLSQRARPSTLGMIFATLVACVGVATLTTTLLGVR